MKPEAEILSVLENLEIAIEPQPPRYAVARIVDFSVVTDSVVATATVVTDNSMRRIVIDWADGETDTLTHRPGVDASVAVAGDDALPPGTYKFSHAYEAPEDGQPFENFVLARVESQDGSADFRIARITLTPRYRVTNYRTTVRLTARCDPFYENANEFDIYQLVDGQTVNHWSWNPSNNFFGESQRFRLEGSGISRELTMEDEQLDVRLQFIERDTFTDDGFVTRQPLSPHFESERVERTLRDSGSDCAAIARYDREVKLIVPLPSSGPVFV